MIMWIFMSQIIEEHLQLQELQHSTCDMEDRIPFYQRQKIGTNTTYKMGVLSSRLVDIV